MKTGDKIFTPRFCTVTIKEVFCDRVEAELMGYTEPTHYCDDHFGILGKSIGTNRMEFAAFAMK